MNSPRETPSWLTLERYALGELPAAQRAQVEAVLALDEVARDCLAQIRTDVRALPPLPSHAPVTGREHSGWLSRWRFAAALVAVLSVALLLWSPSPDADPNALPLVGPLPSVKGDAVALSLVRERDREITTGASRFSMGDRFKVNVTCAAAQPVFADVVVYQDGDTSFPLTPQRIACGNHVVLEGAFRFDSVGPARVCVVLSKTTVPRDMLESAGPPDDASDCVTLVPEP